MKSIWVSLTLGAVSVLGLACNPNSIGRPCAAPAVPVVSGQLQLSHPALECPSRLCIITASTNPGGGGTPDGGAPGIGNTANGNATCTATCNSDSDCTPETTKYCPQGFACAVATSVDSAFCCKKLCICRAGLQNQFNVNDDGGIITPSACDPKIPANTCPNLH